MKTNLIPAFCLLFIKLTFICSLFMVILHTTAFAQKGVLYKDKKHKFEVMLPRDPGDVNDKPFHQVLCNPSLSKTYHIMVIPAKVKLNKQTVIKSVDDQLSDYKGGGVYKIAGTSEFTVEGIKAIDFWGVIAGENFYSRMFVYEEFVYQLVLYGKTDEITKGMYYPFVNTMKLPNGVTIKSPDYDEAKYPEFNFAKDQPASDPVQAATDGLKVDPNAKKVGLVIGVKDYQAVPPLANTINDAKDVAALLKKKGFSVIELYDPKTKSELRNAVIDFNKALKGHENGVGLLYYSGHGMQVDGANYMIPAAATLEIKADIDEQCMNMDYVLRAMEENGNQLNIIILDACRNNPFRSFSRSAEKGLSMVSAPKGSYIVYATKPGSVASDGVGRNGLFTSKLLKFMDAPNISLEEVFKNVAAEVARDSNDQQRPWISSDYTGRFYFTYNN
jgi:hypothetical protein